jgi:enoyl-CoA hydratase/carnithine racemase
MFREFSSLTVRTEPEATVITLKRPERRNALSLEMMTELLDSLVTCSRDAGVRTIIIAAAGKVFCSGHDLQELAGAGSDHRRIFDTCAELMLKLQTTPQPVIAEVQGLATAAGCQLVAACDLAIAGDDAAFATPGVKIGLFCTTPMVPLVRAIGRKRAMEMLLTGQPISSRTAFEWGLINRVVPQSHLSSATRELAAIIATASRETIAAGKRAFYEEIAMDDRSAYSHAGNEMTANASTPDAREGIAAFLSKRTPVWRP